MNSNYEQDAKVLREAMKGWGTDEEPIIKLVGNRSNADRQQIKLFYKTCFGRDLVEDLKDELSGHLKQTIIGMFMTPVEFDAFELNRAMKGAGTNEDAIIEILVSRSNVRILEIKEEFKKTYGRDLEKDIIGETSGYLRKMCVALLQGNRDNSFTIDEALAQKDAEELFQAGEGQWGTEESVFLRIFTLRNPYHLYRVLEIYQNIAGRTIFDSIDREFSGDEKEIMKQVLQAIIVPSMYFASRIYKACKGWGTDDGTLIRVLISRDEIDMPQIKAKYLEMYGVDLISVIKDETSGDYKRMLVEMVSH